MNFVVAHDGFTLRDLFSYNEKNNDQPWPNGPSDGGEDHNISWDQGGSLPNQVKAAKNAITFLLLSAGTPMFTAGDEQFRTQLGNNNSYNLDTTLNWLNWQEYKNSPESKDIFEYTRHMISLRKLVGGLRRLDSFFTGRDLNGENGKDIAWLNENGEMQGSDFERGDQHLVGYRMDLTEEKEHAEDEKHLPTTSLDRQNWKTLVVYFNFDSKEKTVSIPKPVGGFDSGKWKILANTANGLKSQLSADGKFLMESRSSAVFAESK